MDNAANGVSIPLSTFGGLSTELSPSDLPEGGSPDNQDVAYQPGSVLTRPGLSRLYVSEPEATAVVYEKTFSNLSGTVFNVKLYASGNLYCENFTANPGVWALVGTVPSGSFCKSVEAYGQLFMAFSDGFRGTDIVRKFNGTRFSRVSQGGPAGNPAFDEFILPSVALGNSGGTGSSSITSLVSSDPVTTTTRVWVEDI